MKKLSLLFFAVVFSLSALVIACGDTENSKPESTAAPAASDASSVVDENSAQADKSAEKEDCDKCKKGEKHKHAEKGDCSKCKKGEKHKHADKS